jgi:HAD superfamily hydrolase (TIGR01549 family)
MTTPNSFDAILFDLGSTLIYFDSQWPVVFPLGNAELVRILKNAGYQIQEDRFLKDFRHRFEQFYSSPEAELVEYTSEYFLRSVLADWGYPQVSDAVIQSALRAMYAVFHTHWKVEADTHSTLEQLRGAGYRLGMISNAPFNDDVQALVDQAGVRDYFDFVLVSAAVGVRKPNPEIFRMALDYWKIIPTRAAMVGDLLGADILGAKKVGLFSIWITRRADGTANQAYLDTIRPDAQIAALGELPPLLHKLNKEVNKN